MIYIAEKSIFYRSGYRYNTISGFDKQDSKFIISLHIWMSSIYIYSKKKQVQNAKWDSRSKYYILVEYDRNGIYCL